MLKTSDKGKILSLGWSRVGGEETHYMQRSETRSTADTLSEIMQVRKWEESL